METLKAGCYLVDFDNKKVGLIYRQHLNDYSFPKGHLEDNESLEECAVRETAEETKRDCEIIKSIPPIVDEYTTPRGEHCKCYMYVAKDIGKSDNTSWDTHDLIWVNIDEVEQKLTYDSLKEYWRVAQQYILDIIKEVK